MQNENERDANSHQLSRRGAFFLAPYASIDRHGGSAVFGIPPDFGSTDAWPKLFQDMRVSRANEFVNDFREHVVITSQSAWRIHPNSSS